MLAVPLLEEHIMTKTCRICGKPVTGKAKYCQECQKQKEREYQKQRYYNDDDFRLKKINAAKKRQKRQNNLGIHYRHSHHRQKDFNKEAQVVKNMTKKALGGRTNGKGKNTNNDDNYNAEAYKRYHSAIDYEDHKLDSMKECPICGGTEFIRERGMIVCTTCGLCEEVFCMTAYGFDELTAEDLDNDFVRALRKLGENNG